MRTTRRTRAGRGYTLIELALAMGIGMVIAGLGLVLFNQQMAFIRIFRAQDFLTREAPTINNYVVRVVGAAEGYQLYTNITDLVNNSTPVLEDAAVLVLRFRGSDGITRASVMSFEDPGTGLGIYYRLIGTDGSVGPPDWAISKRPTDVDFSLDQGILKMRVTGPNGEELTYSGTEQL